VRRGVPIANGIPHGFISLAQPCRQSPPSKGRLFFYSYFNLLSGTDNADPCCLKIVRIERAGRTKGVD